MIVANDEKPAIKKHFTALDGLRGIAAVGVVLFHFMEIAAPDYRDSFIPHSYLAVDFFFCLSGFVIAYAYDSRLENMTKAEFLKRRLIRLHPLVVIGAVIGLLAFLFDPFSNLVHSFGATKILLMFLSAVFLIPFPAVPQRYFNLFHLNPPTWSLFWEYIANLIYVFYLIRASQRILWGIVIISGLLLCLESYRSGYLAVGFGGDNFWAGGIRLSFSFTAGILLFRSGWKFRQSMPFWLLAIALSMVFFIPYSETMSPVIDPLLVIFYFPLLIALASGKEQTDRTTKDLCKWLGDISYPLYVLHYPFIWLFMSFVEKEKPSNSLMATVIIAGMIFLIVFAHIILRWVDEPLRAYLSIQRKRKGIKQIAEYTQ
nr:acyltransferase [uncultured Sphingobacterium sp.]